MSACPHCGGDLDGPPAVNALDEIAVERIMAGTLRPRPHTTSPERGEAARRLAALGMNDREIGDRIGATPGAVFKLRARWGIPPGQPSSRSLGETSWRGQQRRRLAG